MSGMLVDLLDLLDAKLVLSIPLGNLLAIWALRCMHWAVLMLIIRGGIFLQLGHLGDTQRLCLETFIKTRDLTPCFVEGLLVDLLLPKTLTGITRVLLVTKKVKFFIDGYAVIWSATVRIL
jgi:hypothetical protein